MRPVGKGDMRRLAFQTDLTRISTFVFANEGSNRNYCIIDVADGHHDISHHQGSAEKLAKIARINRFHVEQFAYLLDKLDHIREGAWVWEFRRSELSTF